MKRLEIVLCGNVWHPTVLSASNANPARMKGQIMSLSPELAALAASFSHPALQGADAVKNRAACARSAATASGQIKKKVKKAEVLATVGGDTEMLKTINVWVPRRTMKKLLARGYEKTLIGALKDKNGDDERHDQSGARATYSHTPVSLSHEYEAVEYDLETIQVERAGPPAREIDFAKLQGRFKAHQDPIFGFYVPEKKQVKYAKHALGFPIGELDFIDDVVPRHERIAIRERNGAYRNRLIKTPEASTAF